MAASTNKRAITGLVLIIVGAFFLLDNIGFGLEIPRWIFTWPMIFIGIGLANVLSGNYRAAFFFFSMGGFFYLQQYGYVDIRTYWPVILILVGLSFIFKRSEGNSSTQQHNLDYFDEVSIFGGSKKKIVSDELKGGKITNIFGGSEIDLRDSQIKDGSVIEIFTMFGGCDIRVPQNWKIHVEAVSIFGGFSDSRTYIDPSADSRVKIKGFTMFGGGEIKS